MIINTDIHTKYILARRIAIISSVYIALTSIIIFAISSTTHADLLDLYIPHIVGTFIAAVYIAVVSAFYALYFNHKNSHTT